MITIPHYQKYVIIPRPKILTCEYVAKDKSTSVYFDREKLLFVNLEDAYLKQLKETYKGVDVDSELKKMGLWLLSSKGNKRKGNIGFIINWLNNASPSTTQAPQEPIEQDTPLRPYLNEYLKELWKGREHILELNTRRKKN